MNSRLTFSIALLIFIGLAVNSNAGVIFVADTGTGNVDMHVGDTGSAFPDCGVTHTCTAGQQEQVFGTDDGSVPNSFSPPAGGLTTITSITINDVFGDNMAVVSRTPRPDIFGVLGGVGVQFQPALPADTFEGTYEFGSIAGANAPDNTVIPLGSIFNTAINVDPQGGTNFNRFRMQGIFVADGFPSASPAFAAVVYTEVIPEPTSLMCIVLGVMGLMVVRRRG